MSFISPATMVTTSQSQMVNTHLSDPIVPVQIPPSIADQNGWLTVVPRGDIPRSQMAPFISDDIRACGGRSNISVYIAVILNNCPNFIVIRSRVLLDFPNQKAQYHIKKNSSIRTKTVHRIQAWRVRSTLSSHFQGYSSRREGAIPFHTVHPGCP